jgi:hypothetical protein
LYLGSSTPVQLVIQAEQPSAGLPGADGRSDLPPSPEIGFGGMPGEVREIRVRVANRVSAHLTGPKDMIEITPRIIDPFRYVTADAPISWIWDVRPLKTGQAQVVLDVFSHVKIGQEEGQAQFQVFRDTWKMEAEGLEWVKYQVAELEPIRAFLYTLMSGIVATLAYFGIKGWRTGRQFQDNT